MKLLWASFDRGIAVSFLVRVALTGLHAAEQNPEPGEIRIVQIQGIAEIMPARAKTWVMTQTNQVLHPGDKMRTGRDSRVALRWSDNSVVPFGAHTEIEILAPDQPGSLPGLNLVRGIISFFHRDEPGRIRILTRGAAASVRGTEFVMEVKELGAGERVTLSVLDGKVELSNAQGMLTLTNNQQAVAESGQAPTRTPGFIANNLLQWCFYYPAVLDLGDVSLGVKEVEMLQASLEAYRAGDLLQALENYPAGPVRSDAERIYHAALLLSVGQVAETEAELTLLPATEANTRLANALRTLIAAVKRSPELPVQNPQLATELLAASYYEQSRPAGGESLRAALELARRATVVSPQFGFAWARVAELEFSFGRITPALEALNRSLELAPRNAQALALKGFLLAANNRAHAATDLFDRAIAIDAALGNAWLGRGLCRIRSGNPVEGRADLLVAAALEPQRSFLRSYLGKAFADAGKTALANQELELALRLDPNDPTGWLYAALLKHQQNRVNEAIGDLEQSQILNGNRALYRSRMLLDQDAAVRSASLAKIYQDAGLEGSSLSLAARAVSADYANHSAHQFLAQSFDALRDPTRFNLRYETALFNELLLANVLAPVGGGLLSQNLSQQEYAKLFAQDRFGLLGTTEYRTDGQFRQNASQSGTFGNLSYSLDLDYQHNDGVRPNNDLNRIEWYSQFQFQLTPQDSLFVLAKYEDYESGDNFQYYNPTNARPQFRLAESQAPLLLATLRHEWSPGVQTTIMGGRLANEQTAKDVQAPQTILLKDNAGAIVSPFQSLNFDIDYQNEFTVYLGEVNQILQNDVHTLVFGARLLGGEFQTRATLTNAAAFPTFFLDPPADAQTSETYRRVSGYGYDTVRLLDSLWLTLGLSYESMTYPANYRSPPISAGEKHRDLIGPKAGFIWNPWPNLTLRGAYAQSLGGASYDESFRLEPVQLAGFAQTYRSLISESVVGTLSGQLFEVRGLGADLHLPYRTYLSLQAEWLTMDTSGPIGVFYDNFLLGSQPEVFPGSLQRELAYEEQSLNFSLTKLIGHHWAVGLTYRLTQSEIQTVYPEIPLAIEPKADSAQRAVLQQLVGFVQFTHSSGFFARGEALWYHQRNHGYSPALPGDSFVQANLYAGWRSARRRVEATFGVLNISDQDYRLNPLTPYSELPRSCVFMARLRFNF